MSQETDKRASSIQKPRLCFTDEDVQVVRVCAPANAEADSQLRNPVLTKTSLDDATFSSPNPNPKDSQLPLDKSDVLVPTNNDSSLAAIASSPMVQKFLQRSIHLPVDDLFASGTVYQLMDSSLNQVNSFDTAYTGSYNSENYEISKALDPENLEKPNSKETAKGHTTNGPRLSRSKTCHQKSSIGVVLGSIWIRTSTLKVAEASSITSGKLEVITSFIFYPASWLTKVGLRYGTEANLKWSPTGGWKFTVSSVKAVPENSLIFDMCKQGNIPAVQLMLTRGDASTKDTSPKGWTPLHVSPLDLCDNGQSSLISSSLLPLRAMWTCVLL